jgi:hypothetical protein
METIAEAGRLVVCPRVSTRKTVFHAQLLEKYLRRLGPSRHAVGISLSDAADFLLGLQRLPDSLAATAEDAPIAKTDSAHHLARWHYGSREGDGPVTRKLYGTQSSRDRPVLNCGLLSCLVSPWIWSKKRLDSSTSISLPLPHGRGSEKPLNRRLADLPRRNPNYFSKIKP